ncbi:ribonuclease domain-containing protein [Butyrivibrio sp. FCS014]|uniref:ribonuclease domain-containing protein n=1 Tax=Butyrivibrio sp. FCS014 TaxID=1408304 RepID=UPI0004669F40|nr:ribonuclease domain-containing protein [Butyrivibrio sp. FCS014]
MKYNKSKRRQKPYIALKSALPIFMALIMFITLAGCGKAKPAAPIELPVAESSFTEAPANNDTQSQESQESEQSAQQESQSADTQSTSAQESAADTTQADQQDASQVTEQAAAQDTQQASAQETQQNAQNTTQDSQQPTATEPLIDEDGVYTTKEDVALYIHTYGKLPSNFITKKAAKKLGWSGGSLEDYAPGKCIGGDYFGNYEGLLPEDKEYHECDIDTLGKSKRGAKRIIYSDDGYIYYTGDHYESFELLYEP